MCFTGQSNLSNEYVLENIKSSLGNPQYEVWNQTSVGNVLLACAGMNGKEVQKPAFQLLENFIEYDKNNPGKIKLFVDEDSNTGGFKRSKLYEARDKARILVEAN